MSMQSIFNAIVTGIREQGEPSVFVDPDDWDGGLTCMYRQRRTQADGSVRTLKCGIGMLISDEDYKPSMEGNGVGNLIEAGAFRPEDGVDASFYQRMQDAHDDAAHHHEHSDPAAFMDAFLDCARSVALTYGLDDEVAR